ncbi:cobalt-precorrin 5A hydrolase [Acetohalobium arabaticum]|uniref:Cobalamin (Vitamin B12) biosynthesis CbiG protein n=1 Tax=Acetohalobium arabaticum (strain ATCC 49924 / DSM 5501 / Z-7288) TaxID=574087 RepID=D9QVW2_ACEAZ|nr:cobalt-precorrin 5A hydrolase [Acetohalobium arabaticum]ADL12371.1 cobalamin (vitamin B12) biosynthesis CbiG protein [Acetohalobium arabaticum DSM 5501]
MNLAVIAITDNGIKTAFRIAEEMEAGLDIYLPDKFKESTETEQVNFYTGRLKELVSRIFTEYDGLIFVMALGIVIRVTADFLTDKRRDPAVVTVDETEEFVISTLSGHLGGANELTVQLASSLGAAPVITTATDRQGKLAIDMLAKELDCRIDPFSNLKHINAAIVNDKEINIFTDYELDLGSDKNLNFYSLNELDQVNSAPTVVISNQPVKLPENLAQKPYLYLRPRNLTVGIGCRRGVSKERIAAAVDKALAEIDSDLNQVKSLATIDLKSDEAGLVEYAEDKDLELKIISRDKIKNADLEFTTSEFVKQTIGVGGVCEPAALLSGKKMELLLKKTKLDGVTVAVAEERFM